MIADPELWADATRDAVALVAATRADDLTGVRVILRNANRNMVALALAKLLAEAADDMELSPAFLREWSESAITRP